MQLAILQASTRTVRSATKSALDELWTKKMRKQDPEGYRNRFKDLVAKSGGSPDARLEAPRATVAMLAITGG
jgi:hypothetical protein